MIYVKKLLATCAAIAVAVTNVASLSAFAADNSDALVFSLATDKTEYEVGDIVRLTLRIDNNPGVNGWKVLINYDEGFEPISDIVEEFVTIFPDSDDGTMEEAFYTSPTGKKIVTNVNSSQFGFSPSGTTKPFVVLWSDYSKKRANVLGSGCTDPDNVYNYTFSGNVAELYFKVSENVTTPNHKFSVSFDPGNPATKQIVPGTTAIDVESVFKGDASVTVKIPEQNVPVTGVSTERGSVDMAVGSTASLKYKVEPDNATNKKVTWSSSDPTKVSVDANGNIKGLAETTEPVTITVKTEDGEFTASVSVMVTPVYPESIKLTVDKTDLYVGETATATAEISPADATDKSVVFASSNEEIATVDQNGKITALKTGKVTIGAYSPLFKDIIDEKEITVHGLRLTETEKINGKGEVEALRESINNGFGFEINVPEGAVVEITTNDENVTADYDSANKRIVLNGEPEGENDKITVTVTAVVDGFTETRDVDVRYLTPSVDVPDEVYDKGITVGVGARVVSPFTLFPEGIDDFNDFTVRYTTEDRNIADFEDDFKYIVGKGKGKTQVGVEIVADDGRVVANASVTVNVTQVDYTISFAEDDITLKTGSSKQLNFVIDPSNSETKAILEELIDSGWTFTSSDPSVVRVSDDGLIKAYGAGTAIITATNPDYTDGNGGERLVICKVNVISVFPPATNVTPVPSTEHVGREKVTGYATAVADSSSAAGPIAATGGEMDSETSNAPAIAAAALGVIALGFVVVARKKRRS